MEYKRTFDAAGNAFQWVDVERVMVLDSVTGEPQRMQCGNSIGTLEMAMDLIERLKGWEGRLVVVRMQAVAAFKV